MNTSIFKNVKRSLKYWYVPMISGILLIALGTFVLFTPIGSFKVLAALFSVTIMLAGLLETYFAYINRENLENWGWFLAGGIFNLVMGILLIADPELSQFTFPIYVGFVVLFQSIVAIAAAYELKQYAILAWGDLLALGIIGAMFGTILLSNPNFAGLTIVATTALGIIFTGMISIDISYKLKKIHDLPKKISSLIKETVNGLKKDIKSHLKTELDKYATRRAEKRNSNVNVNANA